MARFQRGVARREATEKGVTLGLCLRAIISSGSGRFVDLSRKEGRLSYKL